MRANLYEPHSFTAYLDVNVGSSQDCMPPFPRIKRPEARVISINIEVAMAVRTRDVTALGEQTLSSKFFDTVAKNMRSFRRPDWNELVANSSFTVLGNSFCAKGAVVKFIIKLSPDENDVRDGDGKLWFRIDKQAPGEKMSLSDETGKRICTITKNREHKKECEYELARSSEDGEKPSAILTVNRSKHKIKVVPVNDEFDKILKVKPNLWSGHFAVFQCDAQDTKNRQMIGKVRPCQEEDCTFKVSVGPTTDCALMVSTLLVMSDAGLYVRSEGVARSMEYFPLEKPLVVFRKELVSTRPVVLFPALIEGDKLAVLDGDMKPVMARFNEACPKSGCAVPFVDPGGKRLLCMEKFEEEIFVPVSGTEVVRFMKDSMSAKAFQVSVFKAKYMNLVRKEDSACAEAYALVSKKAKKNYTMVYQSTKNKEGIVEKGPAMAKLITAAHQPHLFAQTFFHVRDVAYEQGTTQLQHFGIAMKVGVGVDLSVMGALLLILLKYYPELSVPSAKIPKPVIQTLKHIDDAVKLVAA